MRSESRLSPYLRSMGKMSQETRRFHFVLISEFVPERVASRAYGHQGCFRSQVLRVDRCHGRGHMNSCGDLGGKTVRVMVLQSFF